MNFYPIAENVPPDVALIGLNAAGTGGGLGADASVFGPSPSSQPSVYGTPTGIIDATNQRILAQQAKSGASAGEIAGGVITGLLTAAPGVITAIKGQPRPLVQQTYAPLPTPWYKNTTTLLLVAGGMAVVGVLVLGMTRKK